MKPTPTRHIWKTRSFSSGHELGRIDSYWQSSYKGFGKRYTVTINRWGGGGEIETNLPWKYLAKIFSFAGVPLRRSKWVVDSLNLDERVKAWEQEDKNGQR